MHNMIFMVFDQAELASLQLLSLWQPSRKPAGLATKKHRRSQFFEFAFVL